MRKIAEIDFASCKTFDKVFDAIKMQKTRIEKLKNLVKYKKTYEEESVQYSYAGKDKELILNCMDFFYENLYKKDFYEFASIDPTMGWENYNFTLKYKTHYLVITIIYGIGATCIIGSNTKPNLYKVLDLEKVHVTNTGDILYDDK